MNGGPLFYQKNLSAFKKYNPALAHLLENTQPVPAFQLSEERGEKEIKVQFSADQSQWYYDQPPSENAKDIVNRLVLKNPRLIIFLGLGLGSHLLAYAKNPHDLNHSLIVIEPFAPVFKLAMEVHDFTPLIQSQKVLWFVGQDSQELKTFYNQVMGSAGRLRFAHAIEYIPLPAAYKLSQTFFDENQKILQQAIGHQYNHHFSDPYDGFRGTLNLLDSIKSLIKMPSFDQAANSMKGKPGVVISSGPSLNQSLPFLKEIQDRAVLAACPSALSALEKEGVKAPIWLDVERNLEDAQFLSTLKQYDHIFVGAPVLHPKTWEAAQGLSSYILPAVQSEWLPLPGDVIPFGHSSAHAAFAILKHLGCDPIYLVGQDLAYGENDSHAQGVWDESAKAMTRLKGQKVIQVQGNNGQFVELNVFWHTFLKTFTEEMFPYYSGKIYNVIPESMGAYLHGTERIDPSSLPEKVPSESLNVFEVLQKALPLPSASEMSRREELFENRCQRAIEVLDRLAVESSDFALSCKETLFSPELFSKNWQLAKQPYLNFLKDFETFFSRFHTDPRYQEDRFTYEHLFYTLVQGTFIRGFIDFYSTSEDLEGDFTAIQAKLEVLHSMAKDQSFWAQRLSLVLKS